MGRLTLVPFRKFPMAKRVDRIKPKVLLFSNWSIPSFRSKSGSATSFQLKKTLEGDRVYTLDSLCSFTFLHKVIPSGVLPV